MLPGFPGKKIYGNPETLAVMYTWSSMYPCIRTIDCTFNIFDGEHDVLLQTIVYKILSIRRIFSTIRAHTERRTDGQTNQSDKPF